MRRVPKEVLAFVIICGVMAPVPLVVESHYVINLIILCNIYAVFLASWDLLTGYTGQISFGHALFIGGGAYTAGLLNFYLKFPPLVTIPSGALIAAILGLALGIPSLRLRGPYLALATFSASAIPSVLVSTLWKYTGGEDGLYGIAPISFNVVNRYYLSLALMGVCCGIMSALARSSYGLVLQAIREDETAAMASGVDTRAYKLKTFVLSGFFAGLAGAFYCHNQMHVGTEELSLSLSILVVLMSVVGGIGTIIGPMFGGYLLILLNEGLRFIEDFRLVIYSGAVVIILLFLPRGLLPSVLELMRRTRGLVIKSPSPKVEAVRDSASGVDEPEAQRGLSCEPK